MCTNEETIKTGINIDTVKESKRKAHNILRASESIHLNKDIDTGILLKPTSMKAIADKIVLIITNDDVIICAPLTPTFLPKKPATMEPNNGKIIIDKYII
jgi:hypothetical protein